MTVIDSITRINFLDLLLVFLKFNEKFVNLHQMLHLITDGFFDKHICTVFTYITALFSVKIDK